MKAIKRRYHVVMEMNQGSVCLEADSFQAAERRAREIVKQASVWCVIKMEDTDGTPDRALAASHR